MNAETTFPLDELKAAVANYQAAFQELDRVGLLKDSYKGIVSRQIVGLHSELKRIELGY